MEITKEVNRPIGFINAFWMKTIMAVLMVLDHVRYYFPQSPDWFHWAARMVAPMFAFLVAEGLIYTSNRRNYVLRMLCFGGAMLVGNILLFMIFGEPILNSILISLAIAALMVCCIDKTVETKNPLFILFAVLLFAAAFLFEGAFLCPLLVLSFYYLRQKQWLMMIAFIGVSVLYCVVLFGNVLVDQLFMVLTIIPISLYNGERGLSGKFVKYFFYAFYPLHIWIIYIIWISFA